ncbi:Protein TIC 20-I, chloroplastic [Orobanche gracilis]
MILNGCFVNSRVSNLLVHDRKPCSFRYSNSTIAGIPNSDKKVVSLYDRSFCVPFSKSETASLGVKQLHLSAASTPLLHGEHGSLFRANPKLLERPRRPLSPRASEDMPTDYRYPPMTKKPRWWWRVIACVPYLMPLHETWMFAETAYHLHPFLEDFQRATFPFLRSLGRFPRWFFIAYLFVSYLGIVRRKEFPHFFRCHVITALLLEIALQIVGSVSRRLPKAWYWGRAGMHFWTMYAFAHMFTVLECIRCALAGMYADVPFVSDAAYIQVPYD